MDCYDQIDRALQREIKIVEEDESLTHMEKAKLINQLEREARAEMRECD